MILHIALGILCISFAVSSDGAMTNNIMRTDLLTIGVVTNVYINQRYVATNIYENGRFVDNGKWETYQGTDTWYSIAGGSWTNDYVETQCMFLQDYTFAVFLCEYGPEDVVALGLNYSKELEPLNHEMHWKGIFYAIARRMDRKGDVSILDKVNLERRIRFIGWCGENGLVSAVFEKYIEKHPELSELSRQHRELWMKKRREFKGFTL